MFAGLFIGWCFSQPCFAAHAARVVIFLTDVAACMAPELDFVVELLGEFLRHFGKI